MRLAQVIFDKNDSEFEAKVKQTSWETVGGKKKNFGKESSENKENREKRSEREVSRGRGNNNRKGRGGNRGREFRGEENGIDCSQGDKPSDRGKRARGRDRASAFCSLSAVKSTVFFDKSDSMSVGVDLVALLQKPVSPSQASEVSSFETSQQQGFGQALVFTNSQHNSQMAPGTGSSTTVNSYSPQSLVTHFYFIHHVMSSVTGLAFVVSSVVVYERALKVGQPTASQLSQRQQHQTPAVTVPPPGLESFPSQVKLRESTPRDSSTSTVNKLLQLPSMTVENITVSAHQPQPKHIKLPKRRIPPASKIPASAVEMPGSADVTGLNVQFGALEFGSEPSLSEFGSAASSENSSQIPISLYSKSLRAGVRALQAPQPTALGRASPHASVESAPPLQSSATFTAATSASSATSSGLSLPSSMNAVNSLCLGGTAVSAPSSSARATPLVTSGKAPPNLPQGVPPLLHNQYLVGPGGLLPAYPIYGYDELQMLQSRLPVDYYGIPFATPTALASRDGSLTNNPYSGDVTKFGRGDSASPAPPTTLAQPQQSQSQAHHTAQQPFLNPALPPGYSYTGLPYYTGMPSAFQYGPTMFVPSASAKQHGVSLNTPTTPFQQASGYGQHSYSAGYDDLTQGTAAGDYTKGGYGGSSQAQNKSAGSGPGKGVSASSSTSGLPDMTGSVYNKTQTFDKQGFHAGTPPPFSLPSALGSTGPLAPGAAPGYAPPPFLHILPAHQQPHSQLLHHHLPQDAQSGSGQRSQPSSLQPKPQASKPAYGNSPYWTN
ncbi:ubiquitin associated protein 2 isoform 2 isoform 1-like protein [Camelus ferus]|nr:ubiquitin associated protein 2 isoform 2 isoform 1-like protein [Camelus ferus]